MRQLLAAILIIVFAMLCSAQADVSLAAFRGEITGEWTIRYDTTDSNPWFTTPTTWIQFRAKAGASLTGLPRYYQYYWVLCDGEFLSYKWAENYVIPGRVTGNREEVQGKIIQNDGSSGIWIKPTTYLISIKKRGASAAASPMERIAGGIK